MKNLRCFSALLFAGCLASAFFACRTSPEPDCHLSFPLHESRVVPMGDSTAAAFMLSPFEPDKIWVETGGSNPDFLEIDLKNQTRAPLPDAYGQVMSPPRNFAICPDPYEPLVWIGGNNCPLLKYDKRSKALTEMPVRYVTRIVPRADRTYFVAFNGFYFWDRQKQRLEKETQVPLEIIQRSGLTGENAIVLDGKYTYYFDRLQAEKKEPVWAARIGLTGNTPKGLRFSKPAGACRYGTKIRSDGCLIRSAKPSFCRLTRPTSGLQTA
ncbi:MAG: hypothetical protein IPM81_08370 [Saprospirales bacterium]|nr:hypothetical protein [Saprospirales bacterium]